jgi:hypothetical protein
VLLDFLGLFGVFVLCVFTFRVSCCDDRYDFRIKTVFDSSSPPIVCRRSHVLHTLFVFACAQWCPYCVVFLF